MLDGDVSELSVLFLGLEALVTGTDLLLVQRLAHGQAANVFGNALALVDELGVGLD
ncbi:hypothetical protein D3C85_1566670 [compost metagenome]